jgi:hypothetical protein
VGLDKAFRHLDNLPIVQMAGGGSTGTSWGLGAEPGDGFVDALLEGDFWFSEDGVGFVHGRHVVGDHAAVAGGSDVEGPAGDAGGESLAGPDGRWMERGVGFCRHSLANAGGWV